MDIDYSNEQWKDIQEYKDYQVSNMERIRNKKTKKIRNIKELKLSNGVLRIKIIDDNNKPIKLTFSNIVAKAFVSNPDNKPLVWHIDKNPANNRPENLMYVTSKEICNLRNKPKTCKRQRIVRIDIISNEELEIYNSYEEVVEYVLKNGLSQTDNKKSIFDAINEVCCGRRNISGYGFKWRYYIEPIDGEFWLKHPTLNIWCSTEARVKNHYKLLQYNVRSCGYHTIGIDNEIYKKSHLIAQTFIPNCGNKPIVDHIDENRSNNKPHNLRWVTGKENIRFACNKKVYQYSKDKTTFIAEYDSLSDAAKETNIQISSISQCVNNKEGHHTAGGYWWSYEKKI